MKETLDHSPNSKRQIRSASIHLMRAGCIKLNTHKRDLRSVDQVMVRSAPNKSSRVTRTQADMKAKRKIQLIQLGQEAAAALAAGANQENKD